MKRQAVIWQQNSAEVTEISELLRLQAFDIQATTDVLGVEPLLTLYQPDLLIFPLHANVPDWGRWVETVRRTSPNLQLLATTDHADPERERELQQLGITNLLRRPLTRARMQDAIHALENDRRQARPEKGRPWIPVRFKITLPYLVLTILFAAGFAFLLNQVVLANSAALFQEQLVVAGQQTVNWLAREESRLINNEQRLIFTAGVREGVATRDTDGLRQLLLPLGVGNGEEAIEILTPAGVSILSLRRNPGASIEQFTTSRDDDRMANWFIVRAVIEDAQQNVQRYHADVVTAPWGSYLYVAGPVLADDGSLIGVLLLGKSLGSIAGQVRRETFAPLTIYDLSGQPLVSSLQLADNTTAVGPPLTASESETLLAAAGGQTLIRTLMLDEAGFREIVTTWQVAGGRTVAMAGIAQPQTTLAQTGQQTLRQVLAFALIAVLIAGVVGIFLARRITEPLLEVV
ncbi:MAG: hypothetical protein KDE04_21470, partial [Anaerolineales bacterium]|nr:hypothetical protein [Anaerolineales bacterium]